MTVKLSRRKFVTAAAATGLAVAGSGIIPRRAYAAPAHLVGIDWGGPFIEATKKITAGDKDVEITWDLHAGGAGTVLPKIKAAWPHPPYDIVALWSPIFISVLNEGWVEPLSFDDIPNLRDVPKQLFYNDKDGHITNVPRSQAAQFWAYREDTAPLKLEHIEQLLDPKLKGQICWPGPTQTSNLQILSLALANGGDEHNLEPGWEFLKKMARAGNIGRVANTETEFINSLTTGETSIGFFNMASWQTVAKSFKLKVLTRVADDKGIKAFMYQDGWVILKSSGNKKAAKDYLNFFISPQNNQDFNAMIGNAPVNLKSKAAGFAENIAFTKDELEKYAYFADFALLTTLTDASIKRFEAEIVPIMK